MSITFCKTLAITSPRCGRYSAYTRLPAMGELLDERRRREWERANEIFDDPRKIRPSKPDEEEEIDEAGDPVVIPNEHAWRYE